uniref:NADP-dependent malic enzyme n=1 Tax=Gonium pectorale TaxID=33097 RepID=A0A140JWU7_GONPE|nr:NADP-dependent malic enzyme [Gonium pectorale]
MLSFLRLKHRLISGVPAACSIKDTLLLRGCDGISGERVAAPSGGLSGRFFGSLPEDEDKSGRPTTPWVRQVISGVDLMRHPKYNKGLAFSDAERDRLYLRGLLPPAVLSQEVQVERILLNIRSKEGPLDKSTYLQGLQERNERLYHRVLVENIEELLPVVYTPTVRLACQKYGLMFKSLPRGLFITLEDRGRVFRILKNWPERNVKLLVVSDGERVGDLGDLGVQAVGVPISKISLYTACGGISPSIAMPVMVDVGTDNEELLRSPFYVGVRQHRVRGDAYYELMDEFLTAVKRRFGNTVLVQFEDMAYDNASKLLNMYRTEFPCFNDDMSGTAAAVLAGVMAALPKTGGRLQDHRILFAGEGAVVACVAELFATAVATQTSQTVLDARKRLWLVDSQGLVTRERGDSSTLESFKLPYCHSAPECPDLLSAVKSLKPTVLIGLSTAGAPPFRFTPEVLQAMAGASQYPVIFPLSASVPECTAQEAYTHTDGRALVATEQRVDPVTLPNGKLVYPSQCTSTYIFPGVGLGALVSGCTKLRDEQFIAAADAVSRLVSDEELAHGSVFPSLRKIRDISASVAKAVAQKAYEGGFATALPKPHNLYEAARQSMYHPQYRRYR